MKIVAWLPIILVVFAISCVSTGPREASPSAHSKGGDSANPSAALPVIAGTGFSPKHYWPVLDSLSGDTGILQVRRNVSEERRSSRKPDALEVDISSEFEGTLNAVSHLLETISNRSCIRILQLTLKPARDEHYRGNVVFTYTYQRSAEQGAGR